MRLVKILIIGVSIGILYYTALIYNSSALLLLVLFLIAGPVSEFVLLCIQRRKIDVKVSLYSEAVTKYQDMKLLISVNNRSSFPILKLAFFLEQKGGRHLQQRKIELMLDSAGEKVHTAAFPTEYCGIYKLRLQELRLYDWFGLLYLKVPVSFNDTNAIVYPEIQKTELPSIYPAAGEELEEENDELYYGNYKDQFVGVRDYEPGDALKQIYWKTTARTGKLAVKEYAENLSIQCVVIFDSIGAAGKTDDMREQMYERMAGMMAALLEKRYCHYIAFPISDSKASEEYGWQRVMVSEEKDIYIALSKVYESIEAWRDEKLPDVWNKDTVKGRGKKADGMGIRKELAFYYSNCFENVSLESILFV